MLLYNDEIDKHVGLIDNTQWGKNLKLKLKKLKRQHFISINCGDKNLGMNRPQVLSV